MRKTPKCIVLSLLILFTTLSISCKQEEIVTKDLFFFYFESCPSCEDYERAEEFVETLEELNKKKQWKADSFNLVVPESAEQLKQILKDKDLPDISRSLPLMIIGTEYINGYDAIEEKLEELSTEK